MKKLVIAVALLAGAGVISSCNKQSEFKIATRAQTDLLSDRKDISCAD